MYDFETKNQIVAKNFISRGLGLMFLKDFEGSLVFKFKKPTTIIMHTFFMRFKLDITFYDINNEAIKKIRNMPPWKAIIVPNVKCFVERKSII